MTSNLDFYKVYDHPTRTDLSHLREFVPPWVILLAIKGTPLDSQYLLEAASIG